MRFITDYGVPTVTSAGDYFIGMNTRDGFRGLYGTIADEKSLSRLYIIKGSAGSGKSTLMRRIADAAENAGHNVTRYLCSSDYMSLDGVMIDGAIVIVDGTSPHSLDMRYPGAASELIDISAFWDCGVLRNMRREIDLISEKKSERFERAYSSLRYYGMLFDEIREDVRGSINYEKLRGVADRFVRSLGIPDGETETAILPVRSIGMRGRIRLPSFERLASKIYRISDIYGSGYEFMRAAFEALRSAGWSTVISPDPVCPTYICDIYVPKCGLLLTVENVESAERRINMSRFVIRDQLAAARGRMRLAHKCAEVMLTEAEQHFASCAELHFELERIYSSAMNFGLLDVYTSKLCERIISVADEAAAKPDCEKC